MSGTFNQAIIVGRLGNDPDVKYNPDDSCRAAISLATDHSTGKKTADGKREEVTEWHRVEFWGKLAETVSQYLRKGQLVQVVGSIRNRKWNDQEGEQHSMTVIKAHTMIMLGSKADAGTPRATSAPATTTDTPERIEEDEDLPF
jgi:single-strand DNA-binding protein